MASFDARLGAEDPAKLPPVLPHALRRGRSADSFPDSDCTSGMPLDTPGDDGLIHLINPPHVWAGTMSLSLLAAGGREDDAYAR